MPNHTAHFEAMKNSAEKKATQGKTGPSSKSSEKLNSVKAYETLIALEGKRHAQRAQLNELQNALKNMPDALTSQAHEQCQTAEKNLDKLDRAMDRLSQNTNSSTIFGEETNPDPDNPGMIVTTIGIDPRSLTAAADLAASIDTNLNQAGNALQTAQKNSPTPKNNAKDRLAVAINQTDFQPSSAEDKTGDFTPSPKTPFKTKPTPYSE
jgi:hypothetical protein